MPSTLYQLVAMEFRKEGTNCKHGATAESTDYSDQLVAAIRPNQSLMANKRNVSLQLEAVNMYVQAEVDPISYK